MTRNAMLVGAYWGPRAEDRAAAAARVAAFLAALAARSPAHAAWFRKAGSRAEALRTPISVDVAMIAAELAPQRRDDDRAPIPELGHAFAAWNGRDSTFSARVGITSPHVTNAAVLALRAGDVLDDDAARTAIEALVRAFDPDHAVVRTDPVPPRTQPWASGRYTYHRGGVIEAHPPA